MTYREALGWLYGRRREGERGTHRVRALLARLGHPEGAFPAVHVLGTNGKGSVVAYLEAAFRARGLPYGAYTSPHLLDFRERIRTHLGQIPEREVVAFVEWAKEEAWEEPPGFFDLATALAFRHFKEVGVALAAVEAGVGGEKDATGALSRVALTVITNVGEDHLEALGGTLEAVAREKAGAIREGVPVVTGAEGVGLRVIREVARARGAPLYLLDPQDPLFALPAAPALRGRFQEGNARLAAAALRLLGFAEEVIAKGIATAQNPGRLERFLLKGVEIYLDGAHNPPRRLRPRPGVFRLPPGLRGLPPQGREGGPGPPPPQGQKRPLYPGGRGGHGEGAWGALLPRPLGGPPPRRGKGQGGRASRAGHRLPLPGGGPS
jgi:dihydrofolate synthase/folylpolyglutamate synthase